MKVKKCLFAFAAAVALFAADGLYAEIIVPEEPESLDLDGNPRLFGRLDAGCYESAYMPGLMLLVR